jgi:hypothetical protein
MADHAQGIFSPRPSFFGGKSKGHKLTPSALSRTTSNTNTHIPPVLNISNGLERPDQYQFPPTTPQKRRQASRHSIASSVTDLGSQLRRSRSASLRTNTSDGTGKTSSSQRTPSTTLALTYSPEKAPVPNATSNASRPALSISTFSRNKQSENVRTDGGQVYEKSPLSAVEKPKTPFPMAVPLRHPPSQKEILQANKESNRTLAPAAPIPVPNGSNPHIIFQHIHELASKRISTLDYLRKAYILPVFSAVHY